MDAVGPTCCEMCPERVCVTPPGVHTRGLWVGSTSALKHCRSRDIFIPDPGLLRSMIMESHAAFKKNHLPFSFVLSDVPRPRQTFLRLCCVCRQRMSISGSLSWVLFENLCELVKIRGCASLKTTILLQTNQKNRHAIQVSCFSLTSEPLLEVLRGPQAQVCVDEVWTSWWGSQWVLSALGV